jgi:vitamin B12 transporter
MKTSTKQSTARLTTACGLTAVCAVSFPSFANDKLEEIIITSSRIEMPLREIGTSVSVISEQEIKDRGYNSLADVLRNQPSVSVSNSGGAGKATALRIRGEAGYRTLVLMDGIDISDSSGTQVSPRWEHLQSAGVERVEILRGPQGLMYGADAGGVVNIQSKTTTSGLGGDLSAQGGRYGTQQYSGSLGGGGDTVDFNIFASDFQTDGFNSRTTDTVLQDDDGYENTTAHGRFGWSPDENLRIELIAHNIDADNEYDSCFSTTTFVTVDDCSDEFEQTSYRATVEIGAGLFSHKLAYSDSSTEREFFSEGRSSFAADGGLERIEYLGSWTGSDAMRLVYGVDFETESIDDGSFDTDRDQTGYYAEYQGKLSEQFFVTAGVRYDDNDDFDAHTSWRASAAYLFKMSSGELKFKGTYGTGFRAPSLYEISYNNGPFAMPPASEIDLIEETSEGFDIGLAYYGNGGIFLEAVYFDQQVDDLIDFDLINFSGYLQLIGESSSTGVELVADVPVASNWFLTANYTYNDAEDPNGEQRLRAPKHLANLGVSFRPLANALAINLNARGSYDAVDGFGVEIDDYVVLDLSARYLIMGGLEVFARVDNLLDEDYEEIPTYNTSGTAGYAGVRYSF